MEVALTKALTTLQTRLNQLESQNLVSRRRVRELEFELENCKLEVKKERTRVLEKEEIIVAQQKEFQRLRSMQAKQARRDPDPVSESRYNDVVEEKKALEALVSTLRSHLSRLTDELSNQRAQLDELRSLREHDIQEVREKLAEVESLNLEVERLGGEVEILRGVVEEGLNERRRAKQAMDSTVNYDESASGVAHEREATASFAGQNDVVNDSSHVDFPSPPPSRPQSRQEYRAFGNRAQMSSAPTAGPVRFDAPADELSVVEDAREEARERPGEQREKTSAMRYRQDIGTYQSQAVHENGHQDTRRTRFAGIRVTKDDDNRRVRRTTDNNPMPSERLAGTIQSEKEKAVQTETPFPQIRGERLERLFFSAPEHNEKTCRVCHRHRRPGASDDELDFPSWLPPRKRCRTGDEDGRHHYEIDGLAGVSRHAPFSEDRLPPQTVLVRVLGELEDDFTHYKGIYIELADQYKIIDAASNVAKRNVLAEHLREVIDTLEQKGDQIASLYDLLAFKDKPVSESVVPDRPRTRRSPRSPRSPRRYGARQSGGLRRYATCV
ncbi:uncharacterized protein FOMMEDRAFT_143465 [Fomitiporia mediterranea MF3/22]|uniref:uncharacterized protein n=1 Tax=Fomitiporia mediterranea (strain MF3/22) TaxID=694068 RepID=UPI00044094B6|nr:uncharacterized protein FOMMEDRAFT_143465 [Fomitiporia mediterranea MF3/22]EJC97962.1 hypothetical protein FOMMEDRAFT_143465 [Fomitiporia mediterranea MF3/22]